MEEQFPLWLPRTSQNAMTVTATLPQFVRSRKVGGSYVQPEASRCSSLREAYSRKGPPRRDAALAISPNCFSISERKDRSSSLISRFTLFRCFSMAQSAALDAVRSFAASRAKRSRTRRSGSWRYRSQHYSADFCPGGAGKPRSMAQLTLHNATEQLR